MSGYGTAGERVLTRDEVLALPWPTTEQRQAFAAHVCWAHSWYKHLDLMAGGEFVVVLAADAGSGYPPDAPRSHYGWATTDEYRTRFGHLDYLWRLTAGDPFVRDAGPALRLPPDLLAARFTLYPYASNDFNAPEACRWGIHDDAVVRLRAGAPHPARDRVLAWVDSRAGLDASWSTLSAADQDVVVSVEGSQEELPSNPLPTAVEAHLRTTRLADAVYAGLQQGEQAKVLGAIGDLAAVVARWGEAVGGGA